MVEVMPTWQRIEEDEDKARAEAQNGKLTDEMAQEIDLKHRPADVVQRQEEATRAGRRAISNARLVHKSSAE